MFGVGPQEIVIIGVLFLLIFGPSKLPTMARDLGKFVNQARRSIDDFKSEITAGGDEDEDEEEDYTPRKTKKKN
ncbi:MAG: Sec-independent protein translocase subunit TatA/TatB [Rubrobacteraceae bacterium]|jgi:TatA/E family protein of Tat protein translocase